MGESPGPCAFPPCSHSAVVTMRLLVEERLSVISTCQQHADWLRSYVEDDRAVELLEQAGLH